MGAWRVDLDGSSLSGGDAASGHGCLNVPPEGLGHPEQRTEDATYPQRDGVRHFQDWYEPRIVTLPEVTVCGDSCGCHSSVPELLSTNHVKDPSWEYGNGGFINEGQGTTDVDDERYVSGRQSFKLTRTDPLLTNAFNPVLSVYSTNDDRTVVKAGSVIRARVKVFVPKMISPFTDWTPGVNSTNEIVSDSFFLNEPVLEATATSDQANLSTIIASDPGEPANEDDVFDASVWIRKGNAQAADQVRILVLCYGDSGFIGVATGVGLQNLNITENWQQFSTTGVTPLAGTTEVRFALYGDSDEPNWFNTGDKFRIARAEMTPTTRQRPEIRVGGSDIAGTNSPDFKGPYGEWTSIEVETTSTAAESTVIVYLYGSDVVGESFWFDNLEVKIDEPFDYFSGDTPQDNQYHYSWTGVPGDSRSLKYLSRKWTAREKLKVIMNAWRRRCDDTELVIHTDCEGEGPPEEVGPFGVIGRPRVAEYNWVTPTKIKCAEMTLRFDGVDHRMYILDPSGEPGSGRKCIAIDPVVNTMCRSYDRCYGTTGMCYDQPANFDSTVLSTNMFEDPSYEYGGNHNGWTKTGTGQMDQDTSNAERARTGDFSHKVTIPVAVAAHKTSLAPAYNVPVFSFEDTSTFDEPTIASDGWYREKRVGSPETNPGDPWQNVDGDLDLTGDTRFYYGPIPSADGHAANPTQFAGTDYKPGSTASAQAAKWLMCVRFETESPQVQIRLRAALTDPRLGMIWVNGERVTERAIDSSDFATSVPAGSAYNANLFFSDSRPRTIEITGLNQDAGDFGGAAVNPGYTITRPPAVEINEKRVAIIGDSYVNGAGTGTEDVSSTETFAWRLASLMGATDIVQAGIGATGWLQTINAGDPLSTFSGRIAPVMAMAPDAVIFAGGRNDGSFTQQQVYDEIVACINEVVAADPAVPIYLMTTAGDSGAPTLALQQAATDTVATELAVSIDAIPKISDGVHPSYEGHIQLADEAFQSVPPETTEWAQMHREFDVEVDKTYTFSAWAWADSSAPAADPPITLRLTGDAFEQQDSGPLLIKDQWVQLVVTATATQTGIGAVRLATNGLVPGQSVWFDDIGFAEGTEPVDFSGDTPAADGDYYRWTGTSGNSTSEQYILTPGSGDTPITATVTGDICADAEVMLVGPLTDPIVENLTNDTHLSYRGRIPIGEIVTVDTATMTATDDDGNSRTHLISGNFTMDVGENEIRLVSFNTSDSGNAEICWRNAVTFA